MITELSIGLSKTYKSVSFWFTELFFTINVTLNSNTFWNIDKNLKNHKNIDKIENSFVNVRCLDMLDTCIGYFQICPFSLLILACSMLIVYPVCFSFFKFKIRAFPNFDIYSVLHVCYWLINKINENENQMNSQ